MPLENWPPTFNCLRVVLVLTAAALPATSCTSGSTAQSPSASTVVVDVVDGDTILLRGGALIDLAGIDAPEGPQCHARLSAWMLGRMLPRGSRVQLRVDESLGAQSRPHRPQRVVFYRGRNINLTLVANGAANAYLPGQKVGQDGAALLEAARRAKAAHREAWGACTASTSPYAPWRLRRRPPDRSQRNCSAAYPTVCIPYGSHVGDLDCSDIPQYWNFPVRPPDPHRLGTNGDGVGCPRHPGRSARAAARHAGKVQ
jgi:endonuclease YncB( thermonuclease family)